MNARMDRSAGVAAKRPRRAVVYQIRSNRAQVDEYVFDTLRRLREAFDGFVVVAPAAVVGQVCARLRDRADVHVLSAAGSSVSADVVIDAVRAREGSTVRFDEIVVTDDSWFGPVNALEPVLDRMSAHHHRVWTMTSPDAGTSAAWLCYARDEFETSFAAAGSVDEGNQGGWRRTEEAGPGAVAFRESGAEAVLHEGCPILLLATFDQDPAELDLRGVHLRDVLSHAAKRGLSPTLVLQHLSRLISPHTLNALLSLLSIVPDGRARPVRWASEVRVVAHVEPDHSVDVLVEPLRLLSAMAHIVVTTSPGAAGRVRLQLDEHGIDVEVRAVDPAEGQMGALVRHCADLLEPGTGDPLVVALRAGVVRGRVPAARRYREHQSRDALFAGSAHLAHVLGLFAEEPALGLVLPPTVTIGGDDLGSGWRGRWDSALRVCRALRIDVPLGTTPLEPPAGMWIARAAALSPFLGHSFTAEECRRDVAQGEVLQAVIAHAAGSAGYAARTVLDARGAAIAHAALEYTLDQLAAAVQGAPAEQIALLRRMGDLGDGSLTSSLGAAWRRARAGDS